MVIVRPVDASRGHFQLKIIIRVVIYYAVAKLIYLKPCRGRTQPGIAPIPVQIVSISLFYIVEVIIIIPCNT